LARILAIESSCDETAASVVEDECRVLSAIVASQLSVHAKYGGVVPELASREHLRAIVPVVREALGQAGLTWGDLDAVAATSGPGLAGALLVGLTYAKAISCALGIPLITVNHLEGHIHAVILESRQRGTPVQLPALALIVSGGHTHLFEAQGDDQYRLLGRTRDDAAGEAFDKTAKLLGLPYPGGPELAQLAIGGRPGVYVFPRPMIERPGFEFSFSGLKTAVMQAVRAAPLDQQGRADVAHAVQEAIVSTLCTRALQALKFTGHRALVVAGGVGANRELRTRLAREAEAQGARVYYPRTEFCTDNAAMIAVAGLHRLRAGERAGNAIAVRARWPLSELAPPGRAAMGAGSHLT
jgi:N6-L-threonylcarbamoyladenine synthase